MFVTCSVNYDNTILIALVTISREVHEFLREESKEMLIFNNNSMSCI